MRMEPRAGLVSAAMVLCLSLTAAACSGDDSDSDESASLPSGDPTTFEIETHTTIGTVAGQLGKGDRKRLSEEITGVVQRWFNAAYVGGEYPRSNFRDAFPGFTAGARQAAMKDKLLMSNRGIGDRISGVTPKQSRLWLDVLAVRKRAVGVTARFRLAFRTEGELTRRVDLRGRLVLTRATSGWRVFAHDVTEGGRA